MEPLFNQALLLLVQIPLYLVLFGGLIAAILTWRRNRNVSLLVLIASLLFAISFAGGNVLAQWLPLFLHERGLPARQMGTAIFVINAVRNLLNAVGFGLLFWAAFGWRRTSNEE